MWVLQWCGIWTLIWFGAFAARFIWVFPSLSLFSVLLRRLSSPRWVKAGVYRNSRQAGPSHTAEWHRNVLYALERQGIWNKIVRQLAQAFSLKLETFIFHFLEKKTLTINFSGYFRARDDNARRCFLAVKQQSHTLTQVNRGRILNVASWCCGTESAHSKLRLRLIGKHGLDLDFNLKKKTVFEAQRQRNEGKLCSSLS